MAKILGTGLADTLPGTAFGDLIIAFDGDDEVAAGDGRDLVFGGRGDDSIDGGAGDDYLFGGHDDDSLEGGEGDDFLHGGHGDDVAVYQGNSVDYAIEVRTDHKGRAIEITLVEDLNTVDGDEGRDRLKKIESVTFEGDGVTISVNSSIQLIDAGGNFAGFFQTIQDAVDAASDGATVWIPDGVYEEQVVVTGLNGLTIEGESEDGVIVRAPAGLPGVTINDGLAPGFATGDVWGVIAVDGGSDISIENLSVDGAGQGASLPSSTDNFAGIYFHNTSGEIEHVTITGVRDALDGSGNLAGTQRGNAVYVTNDDGTQRSFELEHSTITDFQKTGVLVRNGDVEIERNHIDGGAPEGGHTTIAQNGIQLSSGGTGEISRNVIEGIGYDNPADPNTDVGAILLFDTVGLEVTRNHITGESSQDVGVFSFGADDMTVRANRFTDLSEAIGDFGDIAIDNDINGLANRYDNVGGSPRTTRIPR